MRNMKGVNMEQTVSSQPLPQSCGRCAAGQKRLKNVTFITWIGDEMITVTDFPAWVCDICGHRIYDARALSKLSLMLNPDAGQPEKRRIKKKPASLRSTKLPPAI